MPAKGIKTANDSEVIEGMLVALGFKLERTFSSLTRFICSIRVAKP
jgi:hypothetical protein